MEFDGLFSLDLDIEGKEDLGPGREMARKNADWCAPEYCPVPK
jgi:hypothetical protein